MSKALLTSKTAWSSRLCALTWKEKVTKSGRSIFQLQVSKPLTGVNDSGLLPTEKNLWSTPTTFDSNNITKPRKPHPGGGQVPPLNQQVQMWLTPSASMRANRSEEAMETESRIQEEHRQNNSTSRESSRTGSVWGTNNGHENLENSRCTLQQGTELSEKNENEIREGNANQSINDQVAHPNLMWSTPVQDDVHHRKQKYSQGGTALSTQAGGSLNPNWVEWLMGYKAGYTDLSHWEILSSRKSSKKSATPSSKLKKKKT